MKQTVRQKETHMDNVINTRQADVIRGNQMDHFHFRVALISATENLVILQSTYPIEDGDVIYLGGCRYTIINFQVKETENVKTFQCTIRKE